ncbi:uncharacterized protein LOC118612014 isoform X2 [Rousettus aegyptiacus]|uniref:Uncharacterized protein n=1 Tax=Rousettus aegyptiacus TaxID=9407 RepID=A0A7J8C2K9_ROUAE|nr:uncharacterized protein LOC118612014 isoform X2 [Rousettus aegyptiacus]KAF6405093.1 hypothetical protein HJG63_009404 [Rousettus aegyptiacus]
MAAVARGPGAAPGGRPGSHADGACRDTEEAEGQWPGWRPAQTRGLSPGFHFIAPALADPADGLPAGTWLASGAGSTRAGQRPGFPLSSRQRHPEPWIAKLKGTHQALLGCRLHCHNSDANDRGPLRGRVRQPCRRRQDFTPVRSDLASRPKSDDPAGARWQRPGLRAGTERMRLASGGSKAFKLHHLPLDFLLLVKCAPHIRLF